ncbi:MAG: hypothetical protein HGJ94_14045 [Desulfosarcina sp.]|nr:hypothetical protein [Desulfosarcina sp.]MBC2741547.1 hypothetical protein [Desulfosarcina sp.]MBC2764461.1 hypothetical protein [Desulfosarcina sp.]
MTALASTDVAVSVATRDKDIGRGGMIRNMTIADITFGDGALTYPTGGVPLPAKGSFGFNKEIALGLLEQPSGDGYVYKYDRTNHKLKILDQSVTTGSTAAGAWVNGAFVEDAAGAETAIRLANTAVDTTYHLGELKEVPNTHTPAATTIRLMFIGD